MNYNFLINLNAQYCCLNNYSWPSYETSLTNTEYLAFDNILIQHYNSEVISEQHYYPFGLTLDIDNDATVTTNPYKYNTKELGRHFGLESYEYGARMMDPQLGMWHTIDNKAELYKIFLPLLVSVTNKKQPGRKAFINEISWFIAPAIGNAINRKSGRQANYYDTQKPFKNESAKACSTIECFRIHKKGKGDRIFS